MRAAFSAALAALFLGLMLAGGCRRAPADGKTRLSYWEKWTGAEAEAMERVVEAFNQAQKRTVVEYLSVSGVERKTLLATAGGDPPDLAGIYLANVASFADRGALVALDDFIREDGLSPEAFLSRYAPVYASMCSYRGRIWAVPTTPSISVLYWNKALFREAGLDPERPPQTLAELDAYARKLTRRDPDTGALLQVGFLPQIPGGDVWAFPRWFGGRIWDGRHITIDEYPENIEAFRWIQSYTREYGEEAIKAFTSSFGAAASPQEPFLAGRVAMIFQGVWQANFVRQFAPGMQYGAAPWPVASPERKGFAVATADMLVIPRGARHPREAWEFIKYVSSINPEARRFQELRGMELLCFLQQKNSPMRAWSPFFSGHHPHPYIAIFRQLAESPEAIHVPMMGIWEEYSREIGIAFDRVRLLERSPEAALAACQKRVSASWAWHLKSLERLGLPLPQPRAQSEPNPTAP